MFHNKLKVIYLTITFLSTTPCQSGNDSNSETAIGVRILNGMAADDFQFPYQVSLQKHRKHHCGGSIISKVKVLTAGHCVTDRNGAKIPTASFTILAGTIKLNAKEYWFSLKKISIHPKFNRRIVQYDCSVIFIDGIFDFQLHKRIAAIPLATQNPEPGTVCYISGWGNIQKNSEIRFPNELQFARITVDQPEECTKVFENFVPLQMLCAGRTNNENAGCGDSGGPLYCNNELSGIVSFGRAFYDSGSPDVYSSVAYMFDWINTTDFTTNVSSKYRVRKLHFLIMPFVLCFLSKILLLKPI